MRRTLERGVRYANLIDTGPGCREVPWPFVL